MKLKVYVEDPRTGEMAPDSNAVLTVSGRNLDKCMEAARELLADRNYPPIQSINAAPDDVLVVYCAVPKRRAETTDATKGLQFRRPPRHQV